MSSLVPEVDRVSRLIGCRELGDIQAELTADRHGRAAQDGERNASAGSDFEVGVPASRDPRNVGDLLLLPEKCRSCIAERLPGLPCELVCVAIGRGLCWCTGARPVGVWHVGVIIARRPYLPLAPVGAPVGFQGRRLTISMPVWPTPNVRKLRGDGRHAPSAPIERSRGGVIHKLRRGPVSFCPLARIRPTLMIPWRFVRHRWSVLVSEQ